MDPYEYARQQGQVANQPAGETPDELADAVDLMDLLLRAYRYGGHLQGQAELETVAKFAQFANDYLAERRVASTGVVDGGFALVFEDGQVVQLASAEPAPQRPDPVIPITMPKDSRMRGLPVDNTAIEITTGHPQRRRP